MADRTMDELIEEMSKKRIEKLAAPTKKPSVLEDLGEYLSSSQGQRLLGSVAGSIAGNPYAVLEAQRLAEDAPTFEQIKEKRQGAESEKERALEQAIKEYSQAQIANVERQEQKQARQEGLDLQKRSALLAESQYEADLAKQAAELERSLSGEVALSPEDKIKQDIEFESKIAKLGKEKGLKDVDLEEYIQSTKQGVKGEVIPESWLAKIPFLGSGFKGARYEPYKTIQATTPGGFTRKGKSRVGPTSVTKSR